MSRHFDLKRLVPSCPYRFSAVAGAGLLATAAIATTATAAVADTTPSTTPSTSATSASAPTASASALAASHNPRGSLTVSLSGRRVRMRGVATDVDATRPVSVVLYVNGQPATSTVANRAGHTFDTTGLLPYGHYVITGRAVNIGIGTANPVIGSKPTSIYNPATRNPHGNARLVRVGQVAYVTGISYDPDGMRSRLGVRLYDNGHIIGATWSNWLTHQYRMTGRLFAGTNNLTVVTYNIGLGTGNPRIARFTVRMPVDWTASYGGAQNIAARMFAAYHWGAGQMPYLVRLWNKESGWRVNAANASGAYGIPQALPGSKMAAFGPNWQSNARTQIAWGLNYIASRYGSPQAAWAHSAATNWY